MKLDIIKTREYIIATDYSDPNLGDFIYHRDTGKITVAQSSDLSKATKIVAYLSLTETPALEGLPLLPPLPIENIQTLAYNESISKIGNSEVDTFSRYGFQEGFASGYLLAKQKYHITLQKMLDVYIEKSGYGMDMWSPIENEVMSVIAECVDVLSGDIPSSFQSEVIMCEEVCENLRCKHNGCQNPRNGDSFATVVNSLGQTVLVGEYIY